MAKAPHLIGYVRVSTDDQNLQSQIDALVAAGVAPDDIHSDKASGAAGKKREGLTAALKDLRKGDVLVVRELSRLGRSAVELLLTSRRIEEKGAFLRVLSGAAALDSSTPSGRLMFTIIAAMAEFERDMIVERTKAGLASARAQGRVGGRKQKFTPEMQAEAKRRLKAGEQVKDVAKRFGVSKSTIHKYFPGSTTAPVHDPLTNEVEGK